MTLRFLTYNVHGCVGRSGRYDADAICRVIEASDADVVALQEVVDDRRQRVRFLETLRDAGYQTVHHAQTLEKPEGAYGIALLSRIPPTEVQEIELGGREPRKALRFHIEHPAGSLDVCCTHFGLAGAERWKQIEKLSNILATADDRHRDALQVLMGDLNEWRPMTRLMRTLRQHFSEISTIPTFPSRRPLLALDRVAIRGHYQSTVFQRIDSAPAANASDHRPLLAMVQLNPAHVSPPT